MVTEHLSLAIMENQFQLDLLGYGTEPLITNGVSLDSSNEFLDFPIDPFYSSALDVIPYPISQIEPISSFFDINGDDLGMWEDVSKSFSELSEIDGSDSSTTQIETKEEIKCLGSDSVKGSEKKKMGERLKSNCIDKQTLSEFFCKPIVLAAKELKVGVTVLKKRCRDFGITRWPYRKIKSVDSLIDSVQDLRKGGGDSSEKWLRSELEALQEEKRLIMEESPDTPLKLETKKLRQACFKANYKKRRTITSVKI